MIAYFATSYFEISCSLGVISHFQSYNIFITSTILFLNSDIDKIQTLNFCRCVFLIFPTRTNALCFIAGINYIYSWYKLGYKLVSTIISASA